MKLLWYSHFSAILSNGISGMDVSVVDLIYKLDVDM